MSHRVLDISSVSTYFLHLRLLPGQHKVVLIMAAIEIFSSCVSYKYKSRIYSLASVVVILFIVLSLLTPLFIIYNAGGKNNFDLYGHL